MLIPCNVPFRSVADRAILSHWPSLRSVPNGWYQGSLSTSDWPFHTDDRDLP